MQRSMVTAGKRYRPLESTALPFIATWRKRRLQRRALAQAHREFGATHAHCAELLFDRHFLLNRGAEALARRDAEILVYAWTEQFRYRDERRRQRDVRQLVPIAESFLEGLSAWEERLGRR